MEHGKPPYGHCFTAACNNIANALHSPVNVESSITPEKRIQIDALWDTGATGSLIRPEVAQKLNLEAVSIVPINTPTGRDILSKVYVINIYLPNQVRVNSVRVVEGIPNSCDMLIGMDVIALGDFAVSNYNGRTTFSFRIPSMTEIDFCKHSYATPIINSGKIGRNDPCPCGSGKKYKYCCGK
jgi:predicted aspartyl protease